MPMTDTEKKVMRSMKKRYGTRWAEVFYPWERKHRAERKAKAGR